MIKVRVVRGALATLPVASGLVLTGGLAACTAPATGEPSTGEAAFTTADPGTGVFSVQYQYWNPTVYVVQAKNSTDEFVRAKEKMTFTVPASNLWTAIYGSTVPVPTDDARLKRLSATLTVTFVRGGAEYASQTTPIDSFTGTGYGLVAVTSSPFVVDAKAESMRFQIDVKDAADSSQSGSIIAAHLSEVPVFGGDVPAKTAVFDTVGGTYRSRVVEGGGPVAGTDLTLAYADWRAQTLMDSASLDRNIGTYESGSRFGTFDTPMLGDVEYEVQMGYAIDGDGHSEIELVANNASKIVAGSNRTGYEARISVPGGARKLDVYFHVRAFVKVDYSRYSNIKSKRYPDGSRVLVREKWDNAQGVSGQNWSFPIESP